MASRNRGQRKPKINDLALHWPSKDEADAVEALINDSTAPALAVAILSASYLEYRLEALIRPRLNRRDDETWEELTGGLGPLRSLNEKVQMAYALAIINDTLRSALNTVRKIRNGFAHSKRIIGFDHPLIAEELRALKLPDNPRSLLYRRLKLIKDARSQEQERFVFLCLILDTELFKKRLKRESARYVRRTREKKKKAVTDLGFTPWGFGAPQEPGLLNALQAFRRPRNEGQKTAPHAPSGDRSRKE